MADASYQPKVYRKQGGDEFVVASGGSIDIESGGALKVSGTDKTATLSAAIVGAAAGYKIARGETSVTGTADIATGLATVVQAVACLEDDIALTAAWVSVADSATPGNIVLKVWKPTGSADCTPTAATTAKSVRWIAIGT